VRFGQWPETSGAGNAPGSQVLDARWEYAPFQRPEYFVFVDVVDDTRISLACQSGADTDSYRTKIRIIILAVPQ